jgi:hypothetical protein
MIEYLEKTYKAIEKYEDSLCIRTKCEYCPLAIEVKDMYNESQYVCAGVTIRKSIDNDIKKVIERKS